MIRSKPLPKDIEQRLPKAAAFLQSEPDVVFAYLFGGLAQRSRRPLSDVDIAVYLSDGCAGEAAKLHILGRLNDILETDEIDLVVLNQAPPALTMNILRDKRLLADKAPPRRHRFESLAFRKYFDFLPIESAMLKRRVLYG